MYSRKAARHSAASLQGRQRSRQRANVGVRVATHGARAPATASPLERRKVQPNTRAKLQAHPLHRHLPPAPLAPAGRVRQLAAAVLQRLWWRRGSRLVGGGGGRALEGAALQGTSLRLAHLRLAGPGVLGGGLRAPVYLAQYLRIARLNLRHRRYQGPVGF